MAAVLGFAAAVLARVVALFFFVVLPFAETVAPAFVALRAGAFSAVERLTIGLGRADFPANVRFLAEDVEEF
ncbi:MAG TPA: hypothetical protein VD966_12810 [Pyrinomonadaceae bacterium]|nr:hypothetical protein [Pyrinomonadaceae bacterium]